MPRLRDIAKLIRTKNAGPFQLTLDIMFPDAKSYEHVVASGVINKAAMAAFFKVDESKVKIKAGEYDEKSASEAFREQDILEAAVDIMIAHAEEEDRRAWLTFAQSIDDAELLADMFRYKGYPVEAVHSKRGDRDDVLAKHRRGELIGRFVAGLAAVVCCGGLWIVLHQIWIGLTTGRFRAGSMVGS